MSWTELARVNEKRSTGDCACPETVRCSPTLAPIPKLALRNVARVPQRVRGMANRSQAGISSENMRESSQSTS